VGRAVTTQRTFDITDALRTDGGENVLAVRVTTRNREWGFDAMVLLVLGRHLSRRDALRAAGIAPDGLFGRTTLLPGGGADLDLEFVASGAAMVAGRVVAPDGVEVKKFETQLGAQGRGSGPYCRAGASAALDGGESGLVPRGVGAPLWDGKCAALQ
jgi:hypothetical protein